jgi:hypothetical protein
MGNCTAVPSFHRTPKSSRKNTRRSTVSSVTNGTQLPLPRRKTYVVHHNLPSPLESALWVAIKNRRKRKPQTNRIQTTRYNILTFIPKNLFEQFHRIANVYFAILIGLNWIPVVNAISKQVKTAICLILKHVFIHFF